VSSGLEDGGEFKALARSLESLARILFAGQSSEATLGAVAHLAQRTIPGCESASVTVLEPGRPKTTVSTGEVAEVIDRHQYEGDAGPCLQAMRTDRVIRVDAYDEERRWPELAAAALAQGVHSSLSLPLVAVERPIGALNLYAPGRAVFVEAEAIGLVFATQAAITLANATAYHRATELAGNLTLALEHRDTIGQAKGILIAQDGVSAEEAFDILRRASQRSNRKLHDLAADLVARHTPADPTA
jgi:GAF domain-containing protein